MDAHAEAGWTEELALRRALEERQRRLAELARELAAAIGDPRSVIDLVAQRLGELCGGSCSIRLVSDGRLEHTGSLYDPDPACATAMRRLVEGAARVGARMFEQVAATGTTMRIDAFVPGPFHDRLRSELAEQLAIVTGRSILVVPLRVGGKVIGVAGVCRHVRGAPYDESDQGLLEDAAQHAALAIANARQLAATQHELAIRIRAQARLRQLSQLSHEFAAATDGSARLLDLVAVRISQIFDDACVVRLVADDGMSFERAAAVHYRDPEVVETLRRAMLDIPQRWGEGFTGRVAAQNESLVVCGELSELAAQTVPSFAGTLAGLGITGLMGVPLRSGTTVIGVVLLARIGRAATYTPEDVEFLEELLDHASLAIQNTRLMEATRRELEERRRTEAALQRTQEQFRHAQKMEAIGRLAGGVAHDFNNLLSVILSCSGLALDQLDAADPVRFDLEQIEAAGQRAADLTRQLLAFSRQQPQRPQVLDLNEIVHDMEKMIRRVIGEDIGLHTRVAPHAVVVEADRGQLHQVVMNLVVNARDAMPCGGQLYVTTQLVELARSPDDVHGELAPGRYAVLSLRDTGMGMDAETREHIFEPFFTTKEQGKGTGLGLSTVFGIVEQSGGAMAVDSAPGRGATFRIYLPCCNETPQSDTTMRGASPLRGNETILLVEDDPQVRKVLHRILERAGYRVLVAEDGRTALRLFEGVGMACDLLLTDVVMPGMGGRELADGLRAQRPELRVLYMSGYNEEALLRHRGPSSTVDLLEKPIAPDVLLARVRDALGRTVAQNRALSDTAAPPGA